MYEMCYINRMCHSLCTTLKDDSASSKEEVTSRLISKPIKSLGASRIGCHFMNDTDANTFKDVRFLQQI